MSEPRDELILDRLIHEPGRLAILWGRTRSHPRATPRSRDNHAKPSSTRHWG